MMKKKLSVLAMLCCFAISNVMAQNWSFNGDQLSGSEVLGSQNNQSLNLVTLGVSRVVIKPDGNVGIGTMKTSGFRLSVEGKIRAREVFINHEQWADFVFEPDYDLMPIAELSRFVHTQKRLPGIPGREDIVGKPVSVGGIQALLLQKIEELTLYIIDLNNRLEELEKKGMDSEGSKNE